MTNWLIADKSPRWAIHDNYLLVFIVKQNLSGSDAVASAITPSSRRYAPHGPLRENMTSSTNRKYITYFDATKPLSVNMPKMWWRSAVWLLICASGKTDTDRQTDERVHHNKTYSHSSREGRSSERSLLLLCSRVELLWAKLHSIERSLSWELTH